MAVKKRETGIISDTGLPDVATMATNIIAWAQQEHAINIEDYALSIGLAPSKFQTYVNDNDQLSEAYEIALRLIGSRRKKLAFAGEIDKSLVLAELALYDPEYREYQRSIKSAAQEGGNKVYLVHDPLQQNSLVQETQENKEETDDALHV